MLFNLNIEVLIQTFFIPSHFTYRIILVTYKGNNILSIL